MQMFVVDQLGMKLLWTVKMDYQTLNNRLYSYVEHFTFNGFILLDGFNISDLFISS